MVQFKLSVITIVRFQTKVSEVSVSIQDLKRNLAGSASLGLVPVGFELI